jgi:SAM-dependent methyltransferase
MSHEHAAGEPADHWDNSSAYDAYMGRWSRLVAEQFLDWLRAPAGGRWLDVGCGTGVLAHTILTRAEPRAILGLDRSERFVAAARERVADPRARFEVADAQALAVESGAYEAVVSGLVLNFIPRPERAAAHMVRAAADGGTVGAYVWDYAGKMQMLRHFFNAAAALDPAAYDLDEGRRFPLGRPEPLRQLFEAAGLRQVEVRGIEIAMDFRDFDDFWNPFLAGQGPAPAYVVSLESERQAALRERLRQSLPTAIDGSIPLAARAWAVKGVR